MKEILDLVKSYIDDKHSKQTWVPGKDWVQYAGPYFDSNEFILEVPSGFKVHPPFSNIPSIVIFLIPVISLFESTERISFSLSVPRVVPER